MKRFYKKRNIVIKNKFIIVIIFVLFFDIVIFNLFNRLSDNIYFIVRTKIEEVTKYYLNDTIKKYLNVEVNDYIYVNMVNNNIVSIDINNELSNKLLFQIINDLEKNIKLIESGEVNDYHNLEMIKCDNGIVLYVPIGVAFNNAVFANLGPKIPIKVNFLENVDAYVNVEVESYGINNSLINLYINISIEEVLEMPIDKERNKIEYKFLIASKLISGKVPNLYGGVNSNSSIVNSDVN
ncbi:MAG: sporulation protein YunB [Bacilli bacterium]|nr:sporulation protein YunB [Bacilli bacterium]